MPDCNSDIVDQITQAASDPKRVEVDGLFVEAQPLKEKLDAIFKAAANKSGRGRGLKLIRVIPPGTVE